ncbi:MAG: SurA N-terminal domain-containing protein [Proteobacteria bacterium]|nr:SurA N-terminal domain-containing protein [Pseudomonadota bacterium]
MERPKEIAEVNGEHIYEWQLFDTMAGYAREVLKKDLANLTPVEYNESKEEALDKLIASELLFAEALSAGYTIEETEVDKAVNDFINSFSGDYTFGEYLLERNISLEDFKNVMKKQLIKERFVAQIISRIPIPSKSEIDSYYDKVKDKLCYPPKFNFYVCYISNPTEAEKEKFKSAFINVANKKIEKDLAESIMKSSPQLIEKIVFTHYERTSENLPGELKDILTKLDELTFSPIYEADDELSVFYLIKKELTNPLPEEAGKEEAKRYLSIIRVKKILDAYIDSLREKYTIKVFLNE